ncbi:MAG: HAMP domain-containing sensor histidine kinase [Vicinamibacteria bacterium]
MVRRFLFPRYEDEFPAFRAEVERLSVLGLRVIAAVCLGGPLVSVLLTVLVRPSAPELFMVVLDLSEAAIGALILYLSFQKWIGPYARGLGVFIAALVASIHTAGVLLAVDFLETVFQARPEQYFHRIVSGVLSVSIVALPLKPAHTFGLGTAILSVFTLGAWLARDGAGLTGSFPFPVMEALMLVPMFTFLTAVLYRQRAEAFLARRRAEESFQELSEAQASLLLEKNAASQSRFAAALSHELNTPLGSLASAFATLVKLLEGFDERLEDDPRRKQVLDDAVRSSQTSFDRLNEISGRMRYLTNLDKAELQQVDLNELCEHVIEFLASELDGKSVQLETLPVPELSCRPQQISAVLSNLLRNAAAAIDENGSIEVSSACADDEVVIQIRDDGRGIPPEELESLFEPAFRVDKGRVATTNWSLFVSRSIMTEHGGRLDLESEPGAGTTATMRLPL